MKGASMLTISDKKHVPFVLFLFIFKGNAQLLALLAVGRISRANRP